MVDFQNIYVIQINIQFSHSVLSDSLWPHAVQHCQASLSITNSWSSLKLVCLVCDATHPAIQPSHPLSFLSPPAFNLSQYQGLFQWVSPSPILWQNWPRYWSFSFSISPSNEYSGLTGLIFLQFKRLSRVFSNTIQKHQFFGTQLFYSPTLKYIHDYWKNHSFD